jgi:hypothetical protein
MRHRVAFHRQRLPRNLTCEADIRTYFVLRTLIPISSSVQVWSPSRPTAHSLDSMEGENEYESLPESSGVGIHLLAGGLAGMSEHTLMFPVDVVKVAIFLLYLLNAIDSHAEVAARPTLSVQESHRCDPRNLCHGGPVSALSRHHCRSSW